MHPPHIPKMLIKKSCLLWIRMVLENFYRYKKNQTNKKQAICFLLRRTLQTNIPWKLSFYMKPYKIDVICSTNRYYSCLLTLSLIGIITPQISIVPWPNLQPAVSMSCTSPCYLLMVQYPVYSCIRCSKHNQNFISLLVKIKQHMMYK